MKLILSSMLALAIAGFPLRVQEPDDKGKPRQEEPKKKPQKAEPPQQPDEQPKPKPEKPPKQEPSPSPKQQPPKQQPDDKQREKQQKQKEQAKPEKNRQQEQTQTTRPGDTRQQAPAKGQRIPPEKFRASFGREHHFRVARSGGDNRRFQYSGYWFEVVEVWPAGWSFEDDCYIEENGDDYYLVDVVHPEIRVLVIVVSA
jgi:hypothetical protein